MFVLVICGLVCARLLSVDSVCLIVHSNNSSNLDKWFAFSCSFIWELTVCSLGWADSVNDWKHSGAITGLRQPFYGSPSSCQRFRWYARPDQRLDVNDCQLFRSLHYYSLDVQQHFYHLLTIRTRLTELSHRKQERKKSHAHRSESDQFQHNGQFAFFCKIGQK